MYSVLNHLEPATGMYWSMLSFDFPMREHTGHCTIRSMAQTLCYDLARAEKAKDGKKTLNLRLESMFVENVMFIFQQQLHGRFFTEIWMTLLSEFAATRHSG